MPDTEALKKVEISDSVVEKALAAFARSLRRSYWQAEVPAMRAALEAVLPDAIASALAQRWRTIDSAPKHLGRELKADIWVKSPCSEGRIADCRYDPLNDSWIDREGRWVTGYREPNGTYWPSDKSPRANLATHFMPLPSPPKG